MIPNPSKDADMHRLYERGYLRMHIAKIFDCRVREVNEALERVNERLPPGEFAHTAFDNLIRRSADLQQQRKGKRRSISHAQNAATGKRTAAVSLPRISILEGSE